MRGGRTANQGRGEGEGAARDARSRRSARGCSLSLPPTRPPPLFSTPLPFPSNQNSDVQHLLEALGPAGLTKLFQQLAILAWAVVAAKGLELAAPWGEGSPLFSYLNDVAGHRLGDWLLETEELLVRLL